jgi:hypothetical protein
MKRKNNFINSVIKYRIKELILIALCLVFFSSCHSDSAKERKKLFIKFYSMYKIYELPFSLDDSRMNLQNKMINLDSEMIRNFIENYNPVNETLVQNNLHVFYPVARLKTNDKFEYLIYFKRTISDTICDMYFLNVYSKDGIEKDSKMIAGIFGNKDSVIVQEAQFSKNMIIYTEKILFNLKSGNNNSSGEKRLSFQDFIVDKNGTIIEDNYK